MATLGTIGYHIIGFIYLKQQLIKKFPKILILLHLGLFVSEDCDLQRYHGCTQYKKGFVSCEGIISHWALYALIHCCTCFLLVLKRSKTSQKGSHLQLSGLLALSFHMLAKFIRIVNIMVENGDCNLNIMQPQKTKCFYFAQVWD